jgi:hypothetical protein
MQKIWNIAEQKPAGDEWWNTVSRINLFKYTSGEDFIRQYRDNLNWVYVSQHCKMPIDFIREHSDFIDWEVVSKWQKLDSDFIREFSEKIEWFNITLSQKLDQSIIREFVNKVSWRGVCGRQCMDTEFIREFKDYINWYEISFNQKLDEDFIREFKDSVNWYSIFLCQKLSASFIEEFEDRITSFELGYWAGVVNYSIKTPLNLNDINERIRAEKDIKIKKNMIEEKKVLRKNSIHSASKWYIRHENTDRILVKNYKKLSDRLKVVIDMRINSTKKIQRWWMKLAYTPITGCMYKKAMTHFERNCVVYSI